MADNFPIQLDRKGIEKILPQRDPFLFLDKGEILGALTSRSWVKFDPDWPIFKGHFPNNPIVPGVILLEILGQTASLIMKVIPECNGLIGIFTGVKRAKFRGSVRPGDELASEARIISHKLKGGRVYGEFEGVSMVNNKEVVSIIGTFIAIPPKEINNA